MEFKNNAIFLLLFTVVVTLADEKVEKNAVPSAHEVVNGPQPPPPEPTTSTPAAPTTVSPPTTTDKPTTLPPTPPPTTPPTPPPTTSKPTPPPTTSKPTPPPTTPKPTPPPTTPKPTPPPTTPEPPKTTTPASKNNTAWVVPTTKGSYCIIANMNLKLTVPYKAENKTLSADFSINKIDDAIASGSCTGNETLVLTWENGTGAATFIFDSNNKTYFLKSVNILIKVNNKTFPGYNMANVTDIWFKHDASVFSLPLHHSYTCATLNALSFNGTALNGTTPAANVTRFDGTLVLSNVHVQAFGNSTEAKFYAPMDCSTVETPDIVPIVVGAVLAGLVVVVLLAYLIGRRRAQARGYLSM